MRKNNATKRTDTRGRILLTGESQRKDGRYAYKYTGTDGKPKFIYSWRLNATDPLPKGKKTCIPLREMKKEIQRDLMDGIDPSGAKMTVCELYKKHTGLKSNVRVSTQKGRNQLMRLLESDLVMKVFSQYRMKRLPRDFADCYTGRAGEIPAFN